MNKRYLVLAAGQAECGLGWITDDEGTDQSGENVEPRHAHGMVVIPEHRRVLPVGVVSEAGLAGYEPLIRITVALGRRLGPVHMNHGANVRLISPSAVQVVVDG